MYLKHFVKFSTCFCIIFWSFN